MKAPEAPEQTAEERRAVEAEVRALLERLVPDHLATIAALRERLRQRLPTAHELVYGYKGWVVISYAPGDHGHEGAVALRLSPTELKLYLSTSGQLPDPKKLLRGSGKQTRWLPLESEATLDRLEVQALMDAVLAQHKPTFATAGHGPTVIRSKPGQGGPARRLNPARPSP